MKIIFFTPESSQPATRRTGRIMIWLRDVLSAYSMHERTRFLSRATDHVDLENRVSGWDRSERRGHFSPYIF